MATVAYIPENVEDGTHLCAGYPMGYECLVILSPGWIFCRDCRTRRQQEMAEGLQDLPHKAVGIQVSDFPTLTCECGGDASMNLHCLSLIHRRWEWEMAGHNKPPLANGDAFTPTASGSNMGAGRRRVPSSAPSS